MGMTARVSFFGAREPGSLIFWHPAPNKIRAPAAARMEMVKVRSFDVIGEFNP